MIKNSPFTSVLGEDMQSFLDMKRSLGFRYDSEEYWLHHFDRSWTELNGDSTEVTIEAISDWITQRPNEGKTTQSIRIGAIRQFLVYRNALGKLSFIPHDKIRCQRHPVIHILSAEEISELFGIIDSYSPSRPTVETARMAKEYPVLFRLILSTGLRRSEAVSIKVRDVDAASRTIIIYNAKGRKDRIIGISADMAELLEWYIVYLRREMHEISPWLFPSVSAENHISSGALGIKFREFWKKTPCCGRSVKEPSTHSLRHTFVVMRMNEWMEQGKNLELMMPYLSRHLGHKSPDETFYYYHQVYTSFNTIRQMDKLSAEVIPEVRVR